MLSLQWGSLKSADTSATANNKTTKTINTEEFQPLKRPQKGAIHLDTRPYHMVLISNPQGYWALHDLYQALHSTKKLRQHATPQEVGCWPSLITYNNIKKPEHIRLLLKYLYFVYLDVWFHKYEHLVFLDIDSIISYNHHNWIVWSWLKSSHFCKSHG